MKNALFLAAYLVFVTAANVLLKRAAEAGAGVPFFLLLIGGNLAGLVGVLLYTGLLRTLPLHVAFPLSRGIAVLGILAASLLFFHETFRATEAAGVALVTAGIILVGGAPRRAAGLPEPAVRTPC
jgi:multidrug transporter EmrE-like cation transporter